VIRTKNRACTGKRRYATEQDAQAQRAELLANGSVRLAVYQCRNRACRGWHVGHLPKPRATR
jgi:hypothetical protein